MDGKNERSDITEMDKWRLGKDKKGGEINGGGGGGKCVCYVPLCLLLSHSDMSI